VVGIDAKRDIVRIDDNDTPREMLSSESCFARPIGACDNP